LKTLKTILLAIILAQTSCGPTSKETSFTFIQITDPQFGFYGDTVRPFKESVLYEKAVAIVNQLDPAFVFITGDFVNDRHNNSQWEEFIRITAHIKPEIPVYYTPGNHDIGQTPAIEDVVNYKLRLGSDRFSFMYLDNFFIGLNSSIIKAGNKEMESDQMDWLIGELKKSVRSKNTIILSHHPFFIAAPDEAESYSNIKPGKRHEYLELFKKYGVDAIFAGHYHNSGAGEYGEIKMITTSAVGKPLGDTPSGIRVVEISEKRINSKYLALDSIQGLGPNEPLK